MLRWCGMVLGVLVGLVGLRGELVMAGEPLLKPGERVIFLGDSITEAGAQPGGYVALVREKLAQAHPDVKVEIVGAGISGNRVPDLEQRLERDVLSRQPNLVVIYIGINDVWHSQNGRGTSREDYEQGLQRLIKKIQGAGARVVLCTPSVIGEKTDGSNPLDKMLEEYAALSRKVARQTKSPLLDLRKRFVARLRQANPQNAEQGVLTSDGVHLNAAGNRFVAEQVGDALHGVDDGERRLRHVVLFQFKSDTTPAQVAEVEAAFEALPTRIREIQGFERGTNVSPENLAQGFTHCFFVTFASNEDRDTYLKHPVHEEFVKLAVPKIEKALVVDYWTE